MQTGLDFVRERETQFGLFEKQGGEIVAEEPRDHDSRDTAQKADDGHHKTLAHGEKNRQTKKNQNQNIHHHKKPPCRHMI